MLIISQNVLCYIPSCYRVYFEAYRGAIHCHSAHVGEQQVCWIQRKHEAAATVRRVCLIIWKVTTTVFFFVVSFPDASAQMRNSLGTRLSFFVEKCKKAIAWCHALTLVNGTQPSPWLGSYLSWMWVYCFFGFSEHIPHSIWNWTWQNTIRCFLNEYYMINSDVFFVGVKVDC